MSARLLLAATRQLAGTSPFVITGDLNCDEADPVTMLTAQHDWPIQEARGASRTAHHGEWATFTGWKGEFNKANASCGDESRCPFFHRCVHVLCVL